MIGLLCLLGLLIVRPSRTCAANLMGSVYPFRRGLDAPQHPKIIVNYELWEPHNIRDTLLKWKIHYPDLVRVTTSQEAYGLEAAGLSDDCPFDEGTDGCLNYIMTIQDFVVHPEGSESSARLPEVLWSGEVHGNEQVGPTAVLEAAQLLLDAATCESYPRMQLRESPKDWATEMEKAKTCRQHLEDMGITDGQRRWLARLVTTRRIVVVPTANALGYFRKQRGEELYKTDPELDPNRDFPYDQIDSTQCMRTIAGRTLNEVFRESMFQLSITFHGGMEIIGYEWGAPSFLHKTSPDETAQSEIGAAYSHYGGGWSQSPPYKYGDMNDFVYPVRGGMEDWAYAASWDTERVSPCTPQEHGGYPKEKTMYGPSTLRVFNMLVETSDHKIPTPDELGTSENVLEHDSVGTGHVSRNIRLALAAAELVEPYLAVREVNELILTDDLVPLTDRTGRMCETSKAIAVPANSRKVVIQWGVGGALTVDSTQLWYAKWSDIPETKLSCMVQPSMEDVKLYMKSGAAIGQTSGFGTLSTKGNALLFSASVDISGFDPLDKVVIIAAARVDQGWATKTDGADPGFPPQSHIVNVRTNETWHHESNGKVIQGRLDWFSSPVTIVLSETDEVESIELSLRYNDSETYDTYGDGYSQNGGDKPAKPQAFDRMVEIILVVVVVALFVVAARLYIRHTMRKSHRSRVREFIDDEVAPSPGLRHKEKQRNGYVDIPANGELELGEYT